MKNLSKIVSIFLLFLSVNFFGQNLLDQNSSLISNYFNSNQTSVQETENSSATTLATLQSDVRLIQNGNYNQSYIHTGSNTEQVVNQNGDNNNSYIVTGDSNKQAVNQKGDYNNYEYYSYYNSNPTTVNTVQNGSNNDIQIFGQNELAKNINIIQNTNDKTLIIKNY